MPLSMVKAGEPNVIKKVGGRSETKKFLENLGFVVSKIPELLSEEIWLTKFLFKAGFCSDE